MSGAELLDQVDSAAAIASGWWLPADLVLGDLRRRPYPCPLAMLGPAERRGVVIRDGRGRRIYDSRPGRPDEGTAPPVQIGT